MATYKEMVYMVLDGLKEIHDDAYYTEEHVLFLLGKIRSLLLNRKYNNLRSKSAVPDSNYQQLCLDMESTDLIPGVCGGGGWIKSKQRIPDLLDVGVSSAYPINMLLGDRVAFIPIERMPYVGYNKWLKNILYVALGTDNYLYAKSENPQFKYLKNMRLRGVFEDAEAASELECNDSGEPVACDILDREFPLDASLQMSCIELAIQELSGARYMPQDKQNNADDDLNSIYMKAAAARARTQRPVAPATEALTNDAV